MGARRWTTTQVVDLAPDRAAVAAARRLARPGTWSQLGCTDALVWGRCQGSARDPYQVTVDLTGPVLRCTCPSRKQPCKHALALLLLWVEHGDAVAEAAAPAAFAVPSDEPPSAGPARPSGRAAVADPEAQARREARRIAAMTAGFAELDRWLGDLVRQGLAGARRQPYSFWDAMAARLVDAQMPGLADRVRAAGGAVQAREDWADHLLAECGRLHLAARAWERRDALPATTVGDLRAFVGWQRRGDEVAGFPTQPDRWVVAGVRQGDDGRIVSQRTWLWGQRTRRWAVVWDFAASATALRVAEVVGSVVDDAVVVHAGSDPPRVAFSGSQRVVGAGGAPDPLGIPEAIDALTAALAANPWRETLPLALADVVLVELGTPGSGRWALRDAAGHVLPVAADAAPWPLLALSGGGPATVVAEWQAGAVAPLAVWAPEPVAL